MDDKSTARTSRFRGAKCPICPFIGQVGSSDDEPVGLGSLTRRQRTRSSEFKLLDRKRWLAGRRREEILRSLNLAQKRKRGQPLWTCSRSLPYSGGLGFQGFEFASTLGERDPFDFSNNSLTLRRNSAAGKPLVRYRSACSLPGGASGNPLKRTIGIARFSSLISLASWASVRPGS